MKKLLSVAALTLLAAAPLSAQGINGEWITEFDRMLRNEGGVVSTSEKVRAKMTLAQKGDSVTGTWQLVGGAPAGAAPRELKGMISGSKVALQTRFQATVNINGETEQRTLTMLYEFAISGDKLEGTMLTKSGDMDMPARPFSAWRETAKQ